MYGYNDHTKSLDGKKVTAIEVSDEETSLRFRINDGSTVVWATEGDCCSESWWADGFELNSLRGATVAKVESVDLPDDDQDRTRQEVDEVYGYRIHTDRGVATFAFRNSSNGYYGGWAYLAEEAEPGAGEGWHEITGNDWRA